MKHLILNLLLLLSLSAFAKSGPETVEFSEPEVTGMKNFSVERVNGRMHLGFDIVIKNPNKIGLVIKPSSLLLNVAGQKVGWVRVEDKMKIKRKSELSYKFKMVGDASDFVRSAFSSIWGLLTGDGIEFNIKGTIKAGVFFFKKKWKIDITYPMSNDEFMSLF
ncbi:LEA type 2 family protein [Paracrocinitomix mangrovi]|uniref:NDR1/HIN1-like protein n=1 Tax=Paracrocinitomix mangrovi TaxID=2862509 RepID=UPI001C8E2B96|nr:LEA type 2 family protein [Paracrocinitomix mangrovi]UKN03521.1 LEA type 2 family protein [Paracrocinitomix mangrovi]